MKKMNTLAGDRTWYKFWPKQQPKSLDYPETPLFEAVETAAKRFPEKPAIIYYGRKISYADLWKSVLTFAAYLHHNGIQKGDRVAIYMPNTPQFVIAYYGILRANAIVVTIDPMLNPEGLTKVINDNQSKAVVIMDASIPLIDKIKENTTLEKVIYSEPGDYLPVDPEIPAPAALTTPTDKGTGNISWKEVLEEKQVPPPVEVQYKDSAVLMYTSGTTGERKGALHTHWGMSVNAWRATYALAMSTASVHLAILPFFHVTGMHFCMTAPIVSGGTMVILSRWDREAAIQAIEKYACSHWINISTMVVDMLSAPNIDQHDLSSLMVVGGGGAPLPKAIGEKLLGMGIKYVEGYGLTEAGSGTHINPLNRPKLQCLGIPSYDVDTKIINPETGKEMPQGESGELIMITESIFKAFWNKPEETNKAFIELDGKKWFRTGDIAYMDEEGYFHMVDRLKRMINRAGFKIWPAAIEGEFYRHPAIKEACIIGTPDERVGEEVKVCIVLKEEYKGKIAEDEIKSWAKSRFAAHEYPRVVEFVDVLPKSASGKILWRILQSKEFQSK